eukprot:scaffold215200_cov42-Prasinocladus_malaysianus.AAC.1
MLMDTTHMCIMRLATRRFTFSLLEAEGGQAAGRVSRQADGKGGRHPGSGREAAAGLRLFAQGQPGLRWTRPCSPLLSLTVCSPTAPLSTILARNAFQQHCLTTLVLHFFCAALYRMDAPIFGVQVGFGVGVLWK